MSAGEGKEKEENCANKFAAHGDEVIANVVREEADEWEAYVDFIVGCSGARGFCEGEGEGFAGCWGLDSEVLKRVIGEWRVELSV